MLPVLWGIESPQFIQKRIVVIPELQVKFKQGSKKKKRKTNLVIPIYHVLARTVLKVQHSNFFGKFRKVTVYILRYREDECTKGIRE